MKCRYFWLFRIALALVCLLLLGAQVFAAAPPKGAVWVTLWFDTEDYILPASDDAAKRLGQMLSERGIRATFKVVGEKARVLERRGRRDVIEALNKHDIAYHTDFHSVHPTPTEYLAEAGWLDGIAEFERRETAGAADVRRIFGRETLSCYGQPGSSWAPQAVAALKALHVAPHGVPCYVDEGTHVGLNGEPFWYAGALTVYHMSPNYTRMELHDADAVESAKKKVAGIAEQLRAKGGGLISIFYHPCEWVHREFWDGVNFRRGANPPREQWKLPPQRSPEETEGAFRRFGEYIDHIRGIPSVRWVTAEDLPLLYPDATRIGGVPEQDLADIAKQVAQADGKGLDIIQLGRRAYSVADQFEVLGWALSGATAGHRLNLPFKPVGLFGPDAPPPAPGAASETVPWAAFREAARDAFSFAEANRRIPARVFIGPDAVAPADFLVGMARAWNHRLAHGEFPVEQGVALGKNNRILPERHVAADTPGLFGGWVIHKEGFRAPRLMELARLQAWTLKPALPSID